MKKILSLLLTLTLVFVFAACTDEKGNTSEQTTSSITQTENKDTDNNTNIETTDSDTIDGSSSDTDISSSKTSKPTESGKPINTNNSSATKPTTNNSKIEINKCTHSNCYIAPNPLHDKEKYPFPTCTKNGFYSKYCPDCYESWYEETEATGHSGGVATCTKQANCTNINYSASTRQQCNQPYGALAPHTWLSNGNCQWCSAKKGGTSSSTPSTPNTPTYTDVLIINDTSSISNKTIETDVYITSSSKVTFNNVTVTGNIYCYGQLTTTGSCSAKGLYAYKYGSMLSCGAFDGTHGKVTNSGKLSCDSVVIKDDALNYAFNKWGKK